MPDLSLETDEASASPVAAFAYACLDHVWPKHKPYLWQRRLLEDYFLVGEVPPALDIPTGLGKTSVIALWLVARAAGADLPLRLVYVVDRRAVVDQASDEAAGLLDRFATLPAALRAHCETALGLDTKGLPPISTLRGRHRDNRAALERPGTAAILIGTVDMIGSRLLFGGYGVRRGMRPTQAALIGVDALIVHDEAHLSRPFQALIDGVAGMRRATMVKPLKTMALSATLGADADPAFRLNDRDAAEPAVAARLAASKRIALFDVAAPKLADDLARRAFDRAQGGAGHSRVAVFCNSRVIACEVRDALEKRCTKAKLPLPALLVGARRVRERDLAADTPVFARFAPGGDDNPQPAFLVATSAGEVGVDLDADHLVCDLVPWERMVQRLGRVNRRATPGVALVDVLVAPTDKVKDAEVEADVARLALWCAPFERPEWPVGADGRREGSPAALAALRGHTAMQGVLRDAATPEPLRPSLTLPLIEAWSMTSLETHPGRTLVAPWLRGWVKDEPQTVLVWRAHLPFQLGDAARARFLEVASPHATETLEVPSWQAEAALRRLAKTWLGIRAGDTEAALVLDTGSPGGQVLTLAELEGGRTGRLLTGQTVMLPAWFGGLDDAGLLDETAIRPVPTIDDGNHPDWQAECGVRVRRARVDDAESPEWRVIERFPLDADHAALTEDAEELRVERWHKLPAPDRPTAGPAQTLAAHTGQVVAAMRSLASRLDLPADQTAMLVAAAEAHDLGKARPEWQAAAGAPRDGQDWAKTQGGAIAGAALRGYRHEFGSLADMAKREAVVALEPADRELALHLVAAHHGWARPVIAAVDPAAAPSVSEARAREAALRFIRLQAHWGAWELAWWEWLLRAADWQASREAEAG